MFPFIYNNTGITDDKVLHFIFAFLITFSVYNYFKRKVSIKEEFFIFAFIFFFLLFIGVAKEIKDFYTPGRNVEAADLIANYIGMSFFYILLFTKRLISKLH